MAEKKTIVEEIIVVGQRGDAPRVPGLAELMSAPRDNPITSGKDLRRLSRDETLAGGRAPGEAPPKPDRAPTIKELQEDLAKLKEEVNESVEKLKAKQPKTKKALTEIVVTGKRIGRAVPLAGQVITAAEFAAEALRRKSQRDLDKAGEWLMGAERRAPRDTPVKLKRTPPKRDKDKKKKPIDEIVVIGKRPKSSRIGNIPGPVSLPGSLKDRLRRNIGGTKGPRINIPAPDIKAPSITERLRRKKTPKKPFRTGSTVRPNPTRPVVPVLDPITRTGGDPRFTPVGTPRTAGGNPPGTPPGGGGGGAPPGVNPGIAGGIPGGFIPNNRRRAAFCPPCKKKKEKNRTKCWKKLVKERRNPKNDKIYKWIPIDCDTGRELKRR